MQMVCLGKLSSSGYGPCSLIHGNQRQKACNGSLESEEKASV